MNGATSNQVFASIIDEFTCPDELREWAVRHGIISDPIILSKLAHLRTLREHLESFSSAAKLKGWAALAGLARHPLVSARLNVLKSSRSNEKKSKCVRCSKCECEFSERSTFYDHFMNVHHTGGAQVLQREPFDVPPWQGEDGTVDEALRAVYNTHRSLILDDHGFGGMTSIYNFPITNEFSVDTLMGHIREIYRRENQVFRINMIFGLILRNRETGEYRYFKPYRNEEVFSDAIQIANAADLKKFRVRVAYLNFHDYAIRQRPNSKWVPVLATNIRYWVNKADYPLGYGTLPVFLKRKKNFGGTGR